MHLKDIVKLLLVMKLKPGVSRNAVYIAQVLIKANSIFIPSKEKRKT